MFVAWIIPLFILAAMSRYGVDTSVGTLPIDTSRPLKTKIPPQRNLQNQQHPKKTNQQAQAQTKPSSPSSSSPYPTPTSAHYLDSDKWPTSYRQTVAKITQRRPRWAHGPPKNEQPPPKKEAVTAKSTSTSSRPRGASSDPMRQQMLHRIEGLREEYYAQPDNTFVAIDYADALRFYEMQYHDGGTFEKETIDMYSKIIEKLEAKRQRAKEAGETTNLALDARVGRVKDEVMVDYSSKSLDGLLCSMYTALGKMYFMANMFESSAETYSKCIDDIEPNYLDAVNGRASTGIVLGQYERAGADYLHVIQSDDQRYFTDAFTGIARILETKEDAVSGGWDAVMSVMKPVLQEFTNMLQTDRGKKNQQFISVALKRLHHALFTYHDRKTKNYAEAWSNLQASHKYKLANLPPWNKGLEQTKLQQIQQIFRPGFWPDGVGSSTRTPIFVIGFPRSGSTLLERVLDAHPNIVGTGENSVFNGRLDDIRNQIVQVSVKGQHDQLGPLTRRLGDEVVDEMRSRWERLSANTAGLDESEPLRLVDKMLTNYYNVGFIHMLYPNALILHVMREPLDTLFSAYKHEFPSGTLEYTSDMEALTEMYLAYRDVIAHWDEVLPGRVKHVRYEDMVNDMPGVARAIISATGLEWDESVLDFHKKKHYVNTMSSTQVRKNVYKDAMKSWARYEKELGGLSELVGKRIHSEIKTTLSDYQPNPGNPEL